MIEDEPLIMMNAEEALADGGHVVMTALNGAEAMARLKEQAAGFAGLITDVRLSGSMSGWEVARRVRETNPQTAVVYMTGDSAVQWASQGVPNSQLIHKPFADAQLLATISMLLMQIDSTVQG